jgi:L-2-hydroxyglutarate oxidase LhgO
VIVVAGGGVVGLAIARSLAIAGEQVCLLEQHSRLGLESSTHNSGVVHAGLYYPAGSLKARLCVEGRERLASFCKAAGVPFVRCGKLVVAQAGEQEDLDRVAATAASAGARVLEVASDFIRAREPHVRAASGLWSPDTGWVNAEALVRALEAEVRRRDGIILPGTPILGIEPQGEGLALVTPRERIDARLLVNAAGLFADEVSRMGGGEPFTIYPCRGEYAELAPASRHMINGLVYPVPHRTGHGLGVHFTRTLDGAVWIGPTIRYQDDKRDYEGDRLPLDAFVDAARHLVPALEPRDVRLSGSGIRAKLHPPGERFADFLIRRDTRNPLLVHAAGIESPGLTASLAIGEMVRTIVGG